MAANGIAGGTAPASQFPAYAVYALRYAFVDRPRHQNFISRPDDHDGPGPLDFFVWCIVDPTKKNAPILVDTGFNAEGGRKRGRDVLRTIPEALQLIGVKAAEIEHVIVTHMHYDHAGCLDGETEDRAQSLFD
jgi:glyoxylase-like metal-dependent hydrolase (beta-lactamase superfamily II)